MQNKYLNNLQHALWQIMMDYATNAFILFGYDISIKMQMTHVTWKIIGANAKRLQRLFSHSLLHLQHFLGRYYFTVL